MQTAEGYYYTDTLGETNRDPIILIHGVGGSHLSWPASMRKVKNRRTITIDLPGHGSSEGSACQTVASYAIALQSVLKSARVYRAFFVGYSLGGQIALHYCANHLDQCAGLGLIACSGEPVLPSRLFDLLNDASASTAIRDLVCSLMFDPATPPLKIKELEEHLFTSRRGTFLADWRAFREFRFPDLSHDLTDIPLWICAARNDRLIPDRMSRELVRRRPGTVCTLLDHCGHGILAEQPALVSRAFEENLLGKKNSPG